MYIFRGSGCSRKLSVKFGSNPSAVFYVRVVSVHVCICLRFTFFILCVSAKKCGVCVKMLGLLLILFCVFGAQIYVKRKRKKTAKYPLYLVSVESFIVGLSSSLLLLLHVVLPKIVHGITLPWSEVKCNCHQKLIGSAVITDFRASIWCRFHSTCWGRCAFPILF